MTDPASNRFLSFLCLCLTTKPPFSPLCHSPVPAPSLQPSCHTWLQSWLARARRGAMRAFWQVRLSSWHEQPMVGLRLLLFAVTQLALPASYLLLQSKNVADWVFDHSRSTMEWNTSTAPEVIRYRTRSSKSLSPPIKCLITGIVAIILLSGFRPMKPYLRHITDGIKPVTRDSIP